MPEHLADLARTALPRWQDGTNYAPRVLITEDNVRYAVALMTALKGRDGSFPLAQFEIDIATEPNAAIEHANRDDVDIYIVDLILPDEQNRHIEDPSVGKELVKQIIERTNAGLIVHSSMPADENAAQLLLLGADDYIEKVTQEGGTQEVRQGEIIKVVERRLQEIIRAKVLAVWRRVQLARPAQFRHMAHTGRVFLIGVWRFCIGSRNLENDRGERIRISATEHALLRYLCAVQDHEVDVKTMNLEILGRSYSERHKRVDNYIYRLRNRLGPSVQLIATREGAYKLLTLKELGRQTAAAAP